MTDYEEINFTGSLMWQLRILTIELCLKPHVCQPQFAKGHYLCLFSGRCFVTISSKQYSQKHNCKFKYDKRTMWHSHIMWNKEYLRSKKEKNKCFTLYITTNMLEFQKYKEKALWENTTDFSNLGKGMLYILIPMQKLIDWNVSFWNTISLSQNRKKKNLCHSLSNAYSVAKLWIWKSVCEEKFIFPSYILPPKLCHRLFSAPLQILIDRAQS